MQDTDKNSVPTRRKGLPPLQSINAYTFEDLVKYGQKVAPEDAKEHGGMAWSFNLFDLPVTHHNDDTYIVAVNNAPFGLHFKRHQVLLINENGNGQTINKERLRDIIRLDSIDPFDFSNFERPLDPENMPKEWFDQNIICDKSLRIDLDEIFEKAIRLPPSRQRSLAITKIEEAIMWLGKDLQRLGDETPYIESRNPSNTKIAPTAEKS